MWRWPVLALLALYSLWLIFSYDYHFIDHVNLAIHETGHLVFTPFGRTMHFLGGTILQLGFPLAFVVYFWRRAERFEAGVAMIWFAESLMYTAYYMSDARALELPLVGGGMHDWNVLFRQWGVLDRAETIAGLVHVAAALVLVLTLLYMADETVRVTRPDPE